MKIFNIFLVIILISCSNTQKNIQIKSICKYNFEVNDKPIRFGLSRSIIETQTFEIFDTNSILIHANKYNLLRGNGTGIWLVKPEDKLLISQSNDKIQINTSLKSNDRIKFLNRYYELDTFSFNYITTSSCYDSIIKNIQYIKLTNKDNLKLSSYLIDSLAYCYKISFKDKKILKSLILSHNNDKLFYYIINNKNILLKSGFDIKNEILLKIIQDYRYINFKNLKYNYFEFDKINYVIRELFNYKIDKKTNTDNYKSVIDSINLYLNKNSKYIFLEFLKKSKLKNYRLNEENISRNTNAIYSNDNIKFDNLDSLILTYSNKKILISFWASWCIPCLNEINNINILDSLKGIDLAFIRISLDQDVNNWKATCKKLKLNHNEFIHPYSNKILYQSIFYNIDTIPQYVLIDKQDDLHSFKYLIHDDIQTIIKMLNQN